MRREGNEIVFDDDDQQRRFAEAINFSERTEKMIAAAMKAALSIEYEARCWWNRAKELCGEAEQPVYSFSDNKLTIETCEPPPKYKWQQRSPVMDYLRKAKEFAVAEKQWDLADQIRLVMDSKKAVE